MTFVTRAFLRSSRGGPNNRVYTALVSNRRNVARINERLVGVIPQIMTQALSYSSTPQRLNDKIPIVSTRNLSTAMAAKTDCEFMANAALYGYNKLEASLTQGGDDRSLIDPKTGTNKYHIMPRPIDKDAIFRGSCTCNAPTERGYQAASDLYKKELEGESSSIVDQKLSEIFEDQRQRIAASLELPEGTEVVLCPSGSDAEYIPIVMARAGLLADDEEQRPMLNVVTQLKEIGAGSSVASGGLYFSTHAPLTGRLEDPDGKLVGFDGIEEISIPARERSGDAIDGSKRAFELAEGAPDNAYTIVHGVFGGKTGLRDNVMPGSSEDYMGVVDACQGRFSLEELHSWLEQDSIVLFTASKFYQAPPFCGAVLIPKRIAEKLAKVEAVPEHAKEMFTSLAGFLTDKELSPCLHSWIPLLKKEGSNNIGLALRWEAGLASMEALGNTPDPKRVKAVEEWATKVTDMVQAEPTLDAWCIERSIISIRLAKEGGGWRNMSELRDVYRLMSLDLSSAGIEVTQEEMQSMSIGCNLGQPVDVADSHAILRIALGSESLASYIDDSDRTLQEDQTAVKKLAAVAKYYDQLIESGI